MTDCCKDDAVEGVSEEDTVETRLVRIEAKLDNHTGILASITANLSWIITNVSQALAGLPNIMRMPGLSFFGGGKKNA